MEESFLETITYVGGPADGQKIKTTISNTRIRYGDETGTYEYRREDTGMPLFYYLGPTDG